MKLNTLSGAFATKGSFQLSYNMATVLFFSAMGALALAMWCGYHLADNKPQTIKDPLLAYRIDFPQKDSDPKQIEHDLAVITEHIGRIEANLIRINALGEHLVQVAGLDTSEFNFSNDVPMGGPLEGDEKADLLQTVKTLDRVVGKRLDLISNLHVALQTHIGHKELSLYGPGKSATKGWVSSFFGHRHDPFTGRKAWHAGVDIVGKEGSEIKALAGGIVSYAAPKGGYGHLVEIQHADGLCTRYGHNKEILVQPGDLVKKGQTIALLGSSGRSTGPHLHLEVHRYGAAVDPGEYFPDLRRK